MSASAADSPRKSAIEIAGLAVSGIAWSASSVPGG